MSVDSRVTVELRRNPHPPHDPRDDPHILPFNLNILERLLYFSFILPHLPTALRTAQ